MVGRIQLRICWHGHHERVYHYSELLQRLCGIQKIAETPDWHKFVNLKKATIDSSRGLIHNALKSSSNTFLINFHLEMTQVVLYFEETCRHYYLDLLRQPFGLSLIFLLRSQPRS